MKVLQVMASCSCNSGVAQVIMRYYRNVFENISFDFLMYWDLENSYKDEIISLGGKVYYTGKPSTRSVGRYISYIDEFFRTRKDEYDAVQLHEVYLNSIILRKAKKYGVKILIAHSHTTKLSESKFGAFRNKFLYSTVKRYANTYFACSEDAGVVAFGKGILKNDHFYVINNAIDIPDFSYSNDERVRIRSEFGIDDSTLVIGHIGRFSPQKNHFFLVNVFCQVLETEPQAKLLLVGDGPNIDKVKAYCLERSIMNSVVFLGTRKDIGAVLSSFDVFCLPSVFEGLGIVLIEAQTNGLPCVVSDVVPYEAGILSSYRTVSLADDYDIWAKEVIKASHERAINISELIKHSGYDIHVESNKYEKLINNLVEGISDVR